MTERQLIQQILNTVDIEYDFVNVDTDASDYDIKVFQQKEDNRPIADINKELENYFNEAGFKYSENTGEDDELAFNIKK